MAFHAISTTIQNVNGGVELGGTVESLLTPAVRPQLPGCGRTLRCDVHVRRAGATYRCDGVRRHFERVVSKILGKFVVPVAPVATVAPGEVRPHLEVRP